MEESRINELQQIWVLPPPRLDGPVHLSPPDPSWANQFALHLNSLTGALGSKASRIEHVGSTSVPGLAAKPVIDIVLVISDASREDDYVPELDAAGYGLKIRDENWNSHRMFNEPTGMPECNLHVFGQCEEVERMLAFRDHLRAHDDDRELYESTKRELAKRNWEYIQGYLAEKELFAILATFSFCWFAKRFCR